MAALCSFFSICPCRFHFRATPSCHPMHLLFFFSFCSSLLQSSGHSIFDSLIHTVTLSLQYACMLTYSHTQHLYTQAWIDTSVYAVRTLWQSCNNTWTLMHTHTHSHAHTHSVANTIFHALQILYYQLIFCKHITLLFCLIAGVPPRDVSVTESAFSCFSESASIVNIHVCSCLTCPHL